MRLTTDDVFLGGRLSVLQPAGGYRAGLDAVLLAAAVAARDGERLLDAGAGVGVVGLCVAVRITGVQATLVERDPGMAALARSNAERNGLAARVGVIEADLEQPAGLLAAAGLEPASFDHAAANPPYLAAGRGRAPANPARAAAHMMAAGAFDAWARFLARMTRDGGTATVIHRADALGEVVAGLSGRFGALDVLPILPRATAPANRILVRGVKGSRRALRLLPPLVLHGPEGHGFLDQPDAILRHGAAIDWGA